MVRKALAEFTTWDTFAGLFVWLFWLDWGQLSSDVHLSLHIPISLLCSQILLPSPSQAFHQPSQCCCRWAPPLSGGASSVQHHVATEAGALCTAPRCCLAHSWQPHDHAEHKLWMPLLQQDLKHLSWLRSRQLHSCAIEFAIQRFHFLVSCMFWFCSHSPP